MKFLIQHNLINEKNLINIKNAMNHIPHEFVGVIPFSRDITSDQPLVGADYIPYGSTLFTNLASDLGWKGLHFDLSNMNYRSACLNRSDMLNDFSIMKAKDVLTKMKRVSHYTPNKDWFIRPSEDLKHFSGTVLSSIEIYEWLKDAMECDSSGSYKIEDDMEIVLAIPKKIQAEWRWFIIDGTIIDGSMYRFRGNPRLIHETDQDTIKEAQALADIWIPDTCCVMDTALVDDKVKVIEFNCINSSGFYDNDISKIFTEWYQFEKSR